MSQRRGSINILEVAICVCVLAILAAVIIPIITHPINTPPKYICQANLKDCVVALHLYCNDYNGSLPSSALVNHSKKWNCRDFMDFATKRGIFPTKPGQHVRTWSEILYNHMKNKDVMFCPKDPVSKTDPEAQVSYWYKLAIDKAWYGEGCAKPCRKESGFAYNEDQVVFYERKSFHFSENQAKPLIDGAVIYAAFMDLHVSTITIKNTTSGNPTNCAANKDGAPMYFNMDGKTGKKLPDGVPARYIDPSRYCDAL